MKAVAALEEQGVSQRIAQDLCAQYGSEAVLEAVAQAQRVVESAGHNPIKNVAGFIVSELKKKRAQKPPPMPPQAQSPLAGDVAAARDELTQDIRTFLITKVKSEWEVWPERTRRDHLDRFEATELPTTPQAVRRLWNPLLPLKNPLISARFFMWLASTRESAWNPSDATLLVFKNSSSETPSNQDATKISPGPSSH